MKNKFMKNKFKVLISVVLAVVLVSAVALLAAGCGKAQTLAFKTDRDGTQTYNENLFYRNDLDTIAPDPSCIAVEEDGKTVFYMYATSNDIETTGYQVWKSPDMLNWVCLGVAFQPERDSWCFRNIWAPEVLEYNGKYYMGFSAGNYQKPKGRLSLGLAVADDPAGPFVQWTGTNADGRTVARNESWVDTDLFPTDHPLYQRHLIDASLFCDDDGKLYLYFVCDVRDNPAGSSIWGMELKDMYTPDYSTAKLLIMNGKTDANSDEIDLSEVDEGYTNEAPFMIKRNGKYYLTFSVNQFWTKGYAVKQAISDQPLGSFPKIANDKGGKVVTAVEDNRDYVNEDGDEILIDDYDQFSGSGHHSFVEVGEELWIVYHGHLERMYGGQGDRGVAIDRVFMTKNQDGQDVLYTNGPTYSLQPLPSLVSGVQNLAPLATVTASNMRSTSSVDYLNDGLVRMHNNSIAQEFIAEKTTKVTLTWDEPVFASALMVYQSFYYDKLWDKVTDVTLYTDGRAGLEKSYSLGTLTFDKEWNIDEEWEFVRAGGSCMAEFNEIPLTKITFTVPSSKALAISDVVVLGKTQTERTSFKTDTYSYRNKYEADRHGWRDNELYDGITIDGDLSDELWQDRSWYSYTSTFNDAYKLRMTTYLGNDGVYLAVDIDDINVSYNKNKAVYQNSSVELMIAPNNIDDVNPYAIQVRIAATGKCETWIGVSSGRNENDWYDYTGYYLDTMIRTKGKGFDVEYMQEKLDVTGVQGYTVECWVPYSAFGLAGKPSSIKCLPTFNTPSSYASYNRTSHCPDNLAYNNVAAYFTFDRGGYKAPLQGETMGDGLRYKMTAGFDATTDIGEDAYVTQTGSDQHYIFVKDFAATKYYFTARITAMEIRNGDAFPKMGLIAGYTSVATYIHTVEASNLSANGTVFGIYGALGTGDWQWNNMLNMSAVGSGYTGNDSVELGVVRDGADFYFFVNGQMRGSVSNLVGFDATTASEIGFVTMNITAKFFDYEVVTDDAVIDAKIAAFKGDMMGNSKHGVSKSAGFDISTDKGADAHVTNTLGDQQYVFFQNLNATDYVIEARITATAVLNNDGAPKMGLIAAAKGKNVLAFFIEPANLAANGPAMTVTGTLDTGDWTWGNMYRMLNAQTGSYTGTDSVTMTVVRSGDYFHYLINGKYYGYQSDVLDFDASTATSAGFLTMNIAAKYFSYSVITDKAAVDAYLDGIGEEEAWISPYESRIAGFESRIPSLTKGGILLTGTSAVDELFWGDWRNDLGVTPADPVYNFGIGGTSTWDWALAYDRIIKPMQPSVLLVNYAGNDIGAFAQSAKDAYARVVKILERFHADFPNSKVVVQTSPPAPSRYVGGVYSPKHAQYHELIKAWCEQNTSWVTFHYCDTGLLDQNGQPLAQYYREDRLHLNAAGYDLWTVGLKEALGLAG